MTTYLPTAWEVRQFATTSSMLAQQEMSELAPYMGTPKSGVTGPIIELEGYFGTSNDVEEVVERFAPTGVGTISADRTWTVKRDFKIPSPLYDDFDDARTLLSLEGPWLMASAAAEGRHLDRLAIGSATSTELGYKGGIFGVRYSGTTGTDTNTLPTTDYATVKAAGGNLGTAYVVADTLDGASSPLSPVKLSAAQEILETRFVLMRSDRVNIALNARQREEFSRHPEVLNRDFDKDISRDENGRINRFGIFNFVPSELLPVSAGVVSLPVWIQRYLIPVYWMAQSATMLVHADRSGARQLLRKWSMNVSRLHEEGFLVVKAKNT